MEYKAYIAKQKSRKTHFRFKKVHFFASFQNQVQLFGPEMFDLILNFIISANTVCAKQLINDF